MRDDDMNSGCEYSFSSSRTVMKMFGTWPLQENTMWNDIKWFLILVSQVHVLISMVFEVYQNCDELLARIEILFTVDASLRGITSFILLRYHADKLITNISEANADWANHTTDSESSKVMKKYARIGKTVCAVQFGLMPLLSSMYATIKFEPLLIPNSPANRSRIFLQPVRCIHPEISGFPYMMLSLLHFIEGTILVVILIKMNAIFCNIGMHLCGQLHLLNEQIAQFCNGNNNEAPASNIAGLIERHCKLIGLTKNLNDVVSIYFFLQFLMSSTMLGLAGFSTILNIKMHNYREVGQSVVMILYVFAELIFTTYVCDSLTTVSENIHETVFNTAWHYQSISTSKDLIFLMMRTSTPIYIKAGNFFNISRITMMNILKTAYSYISFLQAAIREV